MSGEETSESQRLVQGGPPMIWSLIKIILDQGAESYEKESHKGAFLN